MKDVQVLWGSTVSLQLEGTWETHDGDVCLSQGSAPQDWFESHTMLR